MYEIIQSNGKNITLSKNDVYLLTALLIWSLIWKGIALWKAGRNDQPAWFVVILILNTVGILEIIYLAFFQPKQND